MCLHLLLGVFVCLLYLYVAYATHTSTCSATCAGDTVTGYQLTASYRRVSVNQQYIFFTLAICAQSANRLTHQIALVITGYFTTTITENIRIPTTPTETQPHSCIPLHNSHNTPNSHTTATSKVRAAGCCGFRQCLCTCIRCQDKATGTCYADAQQENTFSSWCCWRCSRNPVILVVVVVNSQCDGYCTKGCEKKREK